VEVESHHFYKVVLMKFALALLVLVLSGCGQSENSRIPSAETHPTATPVRLTVQVGGKTGFVDETGKLIINPQWDTAYPFVEGLAMVCVGECDAEHLLGYRYTKNFQRIQLEQTYKFGFIDESGKLAINPNYEEARNFSEGLAAVCLGNGCYFGLDKKDQPHKWGYIDKTGVMVISPQFDSADEFKEGLASVSIGGKWGYIDKQGRFVIYPQYDVTSAFEKGYARIGVKASGKEDENKYKFGYIDKAGKHVWEPSD
jgi:hypothetical protein